MHALLFPSDEHLALSLLLFITKKKTQAFVRHSFQRQRQTSISEGAYLYALCSNEKEKSLAGPQVSGKYRY